MLIGIHADEQEVPGSIRRSLRRGVGQTDRDLALGRQSDLVRRSGEVGLGHLIEHFGRKQTDAFDGPAMGGQIISRHRAHRRFHRHSVAFPYLKPTWFLKLGSTTAQTSIALPMASVVAPTSKSTS